VKINKIKNHIWLLNTIKRR